ncbi:MAG TPA: thermopsin family protease [Candidatus Acidoferrales bacterium]|nr:thermopsin family protease [Candidatus Acidoferrales bacterium]
MRLNSPNGPDTIDPTNVFWEDEPRVWKMKGKAVVSFLLAALFLVSMFSLSTFSRATDSHGAVPGGVTTVGSTDGQIYPLGDQVNVQRFYSKEPAPMGMADFGIRPGGAYEYATNDSIGIVTIASLSTNSSLNDTAMTFQLNVNLVFNTSSRQYVYWIQDVALIDTASNWVDFVDNVWNSSAPSANMFASGVSGNGQVASSPTGESFYYYDCINASQPLPGNNITLTYPATITFNVTSTVGSSGEPTVSFAYDDGYGLITYDTVTFTNVTGLTSLTGFEVNGFNYTPYGTFYDSELILGGPGGGSDTTDIQSDVLLQLEYWNGHNYQVVPNAYNFGSDTAEGINDTLSQPFYYPTNGTISASILPGAGKLGELYDQSQMGIINITSPLDSGTLYVTNASDLNATAWQIQFVGGGVTVTLYPGYYDLQLYNQFGALFDQGNFTVSAGQILNLQIPSINAVSAKTVIGKGFSDNVTVLIAEKGDYAETFNVTAYANSTVIGTQQVSLNATDQMTLTFTWNTTGFAYGNYTISAYVSLVPGETNTANATFTGGTVTVTIPGDIDGNGVVNMSDIISLLKAFGSTIGQPNYNPNCDIANNGKIDLSDLIIALRNFGQH